MTEPRAIDCWVNVSFLPADGSVPDYLKRVAEDTFRTSPGFFEQATPDGLVEIMDRAGVEKVVLNVSLERPDDPALAFPRAHPGRFFLAVMPDLRRGMRALWDLEAVAREHPVVMARVAPMVFDLPPDDRIYYPLYAKCIELDLPISVNTGMPGPPLPGECQHPMHLDRVCYHFPELRICMAHGAAPWWDVAISLMLKYRNLHMMTSAFAPKYLPAELIRFLNSRGQEKILFASDHPALPLERCLGEARALDLREGVLEKYLRANAERLFFAPRKPRYESSPPGLRPTS
jgi:uncharacterized protein